MHPVLFPFYFVYLVFACPIGAAFDWDCSSLRHEPRASDQPYDFVGKPFQRVAESEEEWELTDAISISGSPTRYRYIDRESTPPRVIILLVKDGIVMDVSEQPLTSR